MMTGWSTRVRGRSSERGQSVIIVVILLAVFLLGALGLATDYTHVWARRQQAQAAADAACQAGAADLFLQFENPTAETAYGISFAWIGTDYNCSTNVSSPPCVYAAANGYSGNKVAVTFPGSGICPSLSSSFGTIAHPCMKVTITDPVQMSFARILTHNGSMNTGASAACGLSPVAVPVPLVVLHQSAGSAFSTQGNPTVQILGGPNRSVQVDSSSPSAVNVGGSASVNLTQAGPTSTGADFGVFGAQAKPSGVSLGIGSWVSPGGPFGDPWVTVAAPASAPATAGTATPQPFGWNGCPNTDGCIEFTAGNYVGCSSGGTIAHGAKGCLTIPYSGSNPKFANFSDRNKNTNPYTIGTRILPGNNNPGNYVYQVAIAGQPANVNNTSVAWNLKQTPGDLLVDGGVTWRNIGKVNLGPQTAIFAPGLYYVGAGGLNLGSHSTVRMSALPPSTGANAWRGNSTTATGDGSDGVTFYFSTSATISVDSNSGKESACVAGTLTNCIVSYRVDGATTSAALGSVPNRGLQCSGGASVPLQVPSTIDGNILFGPCTGTYGDSAGLNRGFLFFQNRATPANPSWGGGGQFLLSGFMYFHSSTTGTTCGTTTTCLSLSGNSGAGAFTLGNIVTDKISLGGSSGIKMILNPASTFQILRPQLLR